MERHYLSSVFLIFFRCVSSPSNPRKYQIICYSPLGVPSAPGCRRMLPRGESFLHEGIPLLAMGTPPKNSVGPVVALHADVRVEEKHRAAYVLEIALDTFFGPAVGEQEIPIIEMHFDGVRVVRRGGCQELERVIDVAFAGFSSR